LGVLQSNGIGGVKIQRNSGFKMLFYIGNESAIPDVFTRYGRFIISANIDFNLRCCLIAFAFFAGMSIHVGP
jgi:hypothetical protein